MTVTLLCKCCGGCAPDDVLTVTQGCGRPWTGVGGRGEGRRAIRGREQRLPNTWRASGWDAASPDPSNQTPRTLYTSYLHLISSARNRRRPRPRFPFIWLPQTLAPSHRSSLSLMYTYKYKRFVPSFAAILVYDARLHGARSLCRFSSSCKSDICFP